MLTSAIRPVFIGALATSSVVAVIAAASGGTANQNSSGVATFRPIEGISFQLGSKRAVGYFEAPHGKCLVAVADTQGIGHSKTLNAFIPMALSRRALIIFVQSFQIRSDVPGAVHNMMAEEAGHKERGGGVVNRPERGEHAGRSQLQKRIANQLKSSPRLCSVQVKAIKGPS